MISLVHHRASVVAYQLTFFPPPAASAPRFLEGKRIVSSERSETTMTFATAENQARDARVTKKDNDRKKRWKKAFDMYGKAAYEGSRDAAFRVGECYRDGT